MKWVWLGMKSWRRSVAGFAAATVLCSLLTLLALPGEAFAETTSDNFNQPDGAPSANWTETADSSMAISSNEIAGVNAGTTGELRTGENFTSDQYSQVDLGSSPGADGGAWIGPSVRVQSNHSDLYTGIYYWNSGSPVLILYKRVSWTWTQLGSTYNSGSLPAGTHLKLTASGSTISFYENGTLRISATDSSLTGGSPGIIATHAPSADNWAGGDGTGSTTTYSIGGSVSGLSGAVILQNNSGNDISVSANGSFTFTGQLPDASAYNVSVRVNPTGQSCTVANGSGTIASANVSNVAVTCRSNASEVTDDFNRGNGSVGSNWTDISDGGMAISSNVAVGTGTNANSGEIRNGTFTSDQYSQIEITSTQLSGGQWIGPVVRAQSNGTDLYTVIYWWNNGYPQLDVYKRIGFSWHQLGDQNNPSFNLVALSAGDQVKLSAIGSTLIVQLNGIEIFTTTDTTLTGGSPGIMALGTSPALDNWAGGDAETETANTDVSVSIDPSFIFTVANQSSICNGESNFVSGAGTASTVALGHLAAGANVSGGQAFSVAGNSGGGFAVYIRGTQASQNLRNGSHNWTDVLGSYASPAGLGAGERFGYTYKDSTTSSSVTNPSAANFVALTNAGTSAVMGSTSSLTGSGCVSYDAQTSGTTPAGSYTATIIYTAIPAF